MKHGAHTIKRGAGGFTLLEVLLSLAFISVIAALPFILGNFSLSNNNLTHAVDLSAEALQSARHFAIAEKNGGSWGVKFSPTEATVFEGNSYASRNSGNDRILTLPAEMTISGVDEVVFDRFTGDPNVTGAITLSIDGNDAEIVIREHGFIDY